MCVNTETMRWYLKCFWSPTRTKMYSIWFFAFLVWRKEQYIVVVVFKGIHPVELSLSCSAHDSPKKLRVIFFGCVLSNWANTFCILILPSCLGTAYIFHFIHWTSSKFLYKFLVLEFGFVFSFIGSVGQLLHVLLHVRVWSGVYSTFLFVRFDRWPSMLTINIHWDRRGRRLKHWQFVLWHPSGKSPWQAQTAHFLSSWARAPHSLLEDDGS